MSAVIQPARARAPLTSGAESRTLAFGPHGTVPLGRFLAQVRGLAARLPPGRHAVNLCEGRYRFLVTLTRVDGRWLLSNLAEVP